MNPVAFTVFGLDIRWYGILISIGMVLGILIAEYNCKYRNVNFDFLTDVIIVAIPIGIIGARLYYVIFQFNEYKGNLIDMFNIRQGGLAIHGGIIFGVLAGYLMARRKKLNFLALADVAAPSIIFAQAMGRWGNFFNQEAHGGEVSKAFISHFPSFIQNGMLIDGSYYNPTFLYESSWNLLVFIFLMFMIRKNKKDGTIFFLYVGLYSLARFFIEGMRTDSLMFFGLRAAQMVSILGMILSIVAVYFINYRKVKKE
ncbi:prolipoprotein diacylglyceryl transferase [Clostridium sp. 19966]|uniref:prolipoprotein diacylglyceryl transferase n=1 Tax=Clostridium sp. 19966 TaxID=2768166 RepID=UPI0028DF1552|nr:prolipoprotein diacylglyceryl transferase [Clostridium sp. 19966]MDT8715649.1 prolipoprotein diacylglyceryl transferase [Clostridium sp. 19966]